MTAAAVAQRFYQAFQKRDHDTMGSCYADDVVFSDPVFPDLRGPRARAMWRMLCTRATDLSIVFEILSAEAEKAQVRWIAHYTFTRTGRPVENRITAALTVKNGLISVHQDAFSFWSWSRQALGLPGWLLGWTPLLQARVQATSKQALDAFLR